MSRRSSRGQSLVEFALIVPVFLLILFGTLEFGFVFSHNLTLQYATREGARTGALLADGGSLTTPCGTIDPDPFIVAAVQRVLESPGSPIKVSEIKQIRIFSASATGSELGPVDVWDNPGTGTPMTIDGEVLAFTPTSQSWSSCSRDNTSIPPMSVGVSLTYSYHMVTPLPAMFGFFGNAGPATLTMTDQTVMSLNPKTS